jgi:hypothetical protein
VHLLRRLLCEPSPCPAPPYHPVLLLQWTVYRGKAYDLASFIPHHPGGEWLINLALGRDATALFESYHLRCEVAAAVFGKLPVLEGFPVEQVPRAPCEWGGGGNTCTQ